MDGRLNERMAAMTIPDRIKRLPVSPAGFPVPWFIQWFDDGKPTDFGVGTPDFRVIDPHKMTLAVKKNRCWICGGQMGVHLAFVIGPMCAINRVISEPPSHRECAIFSATACPFLTQPRMRRNEKNLPVDPVANAPAGIHLDRNPGATCVWLTKTYQPFRTQVGGPGVLFRIGPPEEILWFANGRPATRQEVVTSIDGGLPSLAEMAMQEGAQAIDALKQQIAAAMPLLPAA